MLSQIKKNKAGNKKFLSFRNQYGNLNKKGISIMIGYVLLITAAVAMSVAIYQWMKTYLPGEELECPDGVSIFIKDINLNCANLNLDLTLKNNGKFNIAGYFIHATNDSSQKLATIDLSQYINESNEVLLENAILFTSTKENAMKPNEERTESFNLANQIYSIEIIPIRFEEIENKRRLVSCGDSKVKEVVSCGGFSGEPLCEIELGGTCCSSSEECQGGSFQSSSDCEDSCCVGGVCEGCTPETCTSLGYECGTWDDGCEGTIDCETCDTSSDCINGICELNATKFVENLGGISWWKLDSDATDKIGNNDGVVNGATLTSGKFGQAYEFDGSNDYIDININIPSTVTISAWATYTGSGTDMLWCIGNSGTGGPDLFFGTPGSGTICLNTWDSWNNPFCSVPSDITGWHFYTTVIQSETGNAKLYINDILCGTATYKDPTKTSFAISSSNGYDWTGKIDEVMIFNRALSDSEIQQLYNLDLS